MKKIYIKPTVSAVSIVTSSIICTSSIRYGNDTESDGILDADGRGFDFSEDDEEW